VEVAVGVFGILVIFVSDVVANHVGMAI
jgi:hypothetical protein